MPPTSAPWGGDTPQGNISPPPRGFLENETGNPTCVENTEAGPDGHSNADLQPSGNATTAQAMHYRFMTSYEETAKPARLR
eukprot:11154752-Heterocapsa_arctica.AAC.1